MRETLKGPPSPSEEFVVRLLPSRPRAALVAVLATVALARDGCTAGSDQPPPYTPTAQPGSSVAPTPSLTAYYTQKPVWSGCGDGFQCATADGAPRLRPPGRRRPLARRDPAAGHRPRPPDRLPAGQPGRPRRLRASSTPGARGRRSAPPCGRAYDIVGFDPRGVGASTPVHCLTDKDLDALIAYDGSPDDTAEEQGLVDISRHFADGCQARSAEILAHIGSRGRRARHGRDPRRRSATRRCTTSGRRTAPSSGPPTPSSSRRRSGAWCSTARSTRRSRRRRSPRARLGGFERALTAFLADCVKRSDCPVGPTVAEARDQIARLVADSDAHPLPSGSGRTVTQSLVVLGLLYPLYDRTNGWPALRTALSQAMGGDGVDAAAASPTATPTATPTGRTPPTRTRRRTR